MAVRIVQDVPSAGGLRRLGRAIAVLLGAALLLAGMVTAVVPLLYLLLFIASINDPNVSTDLSAEEGRLLAITVTIALAGPLLGLRLIRGRRRLGLFLRKFGLADPTQTVTYALITAVGRRVRLVTLDDAAVAPVGVARGRRPLLWLVTLLPLVAVGLVLAWFAGGGFDAFVTRTADEAASQVHEDDPIAQLFGVLFASILGIIVAVVLVLFMVLLVILLGTVIMLFGGSAALAARRAQRAATQSITTSQAIAPTAARIARRSRAILGAQLVVVKVAESLWQEAVRRLGAVADVVVIDVSAPTENLLWEVATMRPGFADRWILVGAHDAVAGLAAPQTLPADSPQRRLALALDGDQILAYGSTRADQRRFTRALRRRRDALPTPAHRR
jgi:hypothetical protein